MGFPDERKCSRNYNAAKFIWIHYLTLSATSYSAAPLHRINNNLNALQWPVHIVQFPQVKRIRAANRPPRNRNSVDRGPNTKTPAYKYHSSAQESPPPTRLKDEEVSTKGTRIRSVCGDRGVAQQSTPSRRVHTRATPRQVFEDGQRAC